jgi:hypothetical protein
METLSQRQISRATQSGVEDNAVMSVFHNVVIATQPTPYPFYTTHRDLIYPIQANPHIITYTRVNSRHHNSHHGRNHQATHQLGNRVPSRTHSAFLAYFFVSIAPQT